MTTTADRQAPDTAVAPGVQVLPVLDGDRPVGAWIIGPGTAVYRPVLDLTRLTGALLAVVGAVAVATAVVAPATRRGRAIGAVTMGPGGWVSVRTGARPVARTGTRRPLWARLIGAEPVQIRRSRRHRDTDPAGRRGRQ